MRQVGINAELCKMNASFFCLIHKQPLAVCVIQNNIFYRNKILVSMKAWSMLIGSSCSQNKEERLEVFSNFFSCFKSALCFYQNFYPVKLHLLILHTPYIEKRSFSIWKTFEQARHEMNLKHFPIMMKWICGILCEITHSSCCPW